MKLTTLSCCSFFTALASSPFGIPVTARALYKVHRPSAPPQSTAAGFGVEKMDAVSKGRASDRPMSRVHISCTSLRQENHRVPLALALGASAVIGAAALTPTTASAHWHGHGHWHGGIGIGLVAPATVDASDCYVVKKVVETPFGLRVRRITVYN